jgi:hypothetical protein
VASDHRYVRFVDELTTPTDDRVATDFLLSGAGGCCALQKDSDFATFTGTTILAADPRSAAI